MGLATEDLPAHVPAMYMVQAEKAELLIVLRERELETHSLAARGVRPYCYSETAIAKASLDSSRRESGKEQAQRSTLYSTAVL